jgi:hypothetical protein
MKILRVMYNYTLFGIASFVLITLLTHGDPWAYICAYWGAVTLKTLIEAILEATKEEARMMKQKRLSPLDAYAVEARKHGLTYGKYVSLVTEGALEPPKNMKEPKRRRMGAYQGMEMTRSKVCRECGAEFIVGRLKSGSFSNAELCDYCLLMAKKKQAAKMNAATKAKKQEEKENG